MPTVFLEPHVPSCPITITSFSYIYTSTAFWIKFNLYWKFLIFSFKRYWLSVYSQNVDYNNLEVVIVKQGLFIKTEHVKIIEYDFKVLVLMWTPVIWLTENFINIFTGLTQVRVSWMYQKQNGLPKLQVRGNQWW